MADMDQMPEEDEDGGIPEWVVTFGDMMSLLLCFFIMLVSLSELKEEEKFQAMVDSIRREFGYDSARSSTAPGENRPRPSELRDVSQLSRANRERKEHGGDKTKAPVGDYRRVTIIRNGRKTALGAVIQFDESEDRLSESHFPRLDELAQLMRGKPQKIEVRGHTTYKPVTGDQHLTHRELAFRRCENTVQHLIAKLGIEENRFRVSVAGPHEALFLAADVQQTQKNSRVEVFLLDEVVSDKLDEG